MSCLRGYRDLVGTAAFEKCIEDVAKSGYRSSAKQSCLTKNGYYDAD
jgi:LAS superfamily LD-carboxypeptidase LdcB